MFHICTLILEHCNTGAVWFALNRSEFVSSDWSYCKAHQNPGAHLKNIQISRLPEVDGAGLKSLVGQSTV